VGFLEISVKWFGEAGHESSSASDQPEERFSFYLPRALQAGITGSIPVTSTTFLLTHQ
jgi:hypothetical protein